MGDARLRGEWLAELRFLDMSDTTWRVFTLGLLWCVHNGTDGLIRRRHLSRIHPDGAQPEAFRELTAVGIGEMTEEGFRFSGWRDRLGQSTAAEVEAYRAAGRRRAQQSRDRIRAALEREESAAAEGHKRRSRAPRDLTPSVGGRNPARGVEGDGEGVRQRVPERVRVNVGNGNGNGSDTRTVPTSDALDLRQEGRGSQYMGGPVPWN